MDESSVAPRAAVSLLATKLAPLGLPQAVCDGLASQLDALLKLDTADDPRADCAVSRARPIWPSRPGTPWDGAGARLSGRGWPHLAAAQGGAHWRWSRLLGAILAAPWRDLGAFRHRRCTPSSRR